MGPTKSRRYYFGKQMLALKIFGVSLSGNEGLPYKIYSLLLLPPTVFLYPLLDFYEYFKHDASAIGDIIIYQIATFLSLCKITVVLRNRAKFGKLLDKLEREPFTLNLQRGGQVEEELVRECVRLTTLQAWIFWSFTYVTVVSTMIYTVVKRITSDDYHDWQMPYGPLTLLNVTYSPSYEMNCLYQNISILYIGSLSVSTDLLLASVLANISYQFKILQNFVKRMVENGHKKMVAETSCLQYKSSADSISINEINASDIPWKYLKKAIIEAVEYHVAIIDVTKEIDEVFSDLLLIVFLGTLILLCFSTYAASSSDSLQSTGKHIGEGLVAWAQVASVCFWGEEVFQESQLVANAVYESNFVGADLKFQRLLAFIIRRSQNPTKITAGKFTDIGLATLAWILRTSYSAFMVLRKDGA